jgi:hypothetical protein
MAKDERVRRELGISRRELLRKGAIVGGSLLWVTPVVQSLTPPAYAGQTPRLCSCCCCNNPIPVPGGEIQCTTDGFNSAFCDAFCLAGGGPKPGSGGFCQGANCDDVNNTCVCGN